LDMIVRAAKGAYLFLLFCLWMVAILVGVPLAFLDRLLDSIRGVRPARFQAVFRFYLGIFIVLLRTGGLMRGLPSKGQVHEGPCVVVANHPGLFDVLFLIRAIPHMSILVARKLVRRLPLSPIFRQCGYVVSPDLGKGSPLETIDEAVKELERGYRFLLFPEGTRSPMGELLPFKPGAFKIAQIAGVPIQPVLIVNDPPFLPHEGKWYLPNRGRRDIQLVFWDPIAPPAKGEERREARKLTESYRRALNLPLRARARITSQEKGQ